MEYLSFIRLWSVCACITINFSHFLDIFLLILCLLLQIFIVGKKIIQGFWCFHEILFQSLHYLFCLYKRQACSISFNFSSILCQKDNQLVDVVYFLTGVFKNYWGLCLKACIKVRHCELALRLNLIIGLLWVLTLRL